jgi:hypothetical protein
MGNIDRVIRVTAGVFLLYLAISGGQIWGYLGIVPLLTGTIGWCPIYALLGISTACRQCTSSKETPPACTAAKPSAKADC